MKPRDEGWIQSSVKALNEERFAVNHHKIPRISTLVKRGELTDLSGNKDANRNLEMKKSRNECPIIGGKQEPDFIQANIEYDVDYTSILKSSHSEYQSLFLKSMNKNNFIDRSRFDRFDNCQFKTVERYGLNNQISFNGGIGRPGSYNAHMVIPTQTSVIDEDKKVRAYELLGATSRSRSHDLGKQLDRAPAPKFINAYIVNKKGLHDGLAPLSLKKINFRDFLPNSVQNKVKSL
jgi:hypothetical protein